jgi:tetratricopeptide (TPR) repeat protein
LESALRHLQTSVKHPDYALGSRLLLAQIQHQLGRLPEAAAEYMEALKVADSMVVPSEQSDEVRQLYEPLLESLTNQTDTSVMEQFCENVKQMLLRPNWRASVLLAREQLPKPKEGMPPLPLAEILVQAHSSQVIEAISKVRSLAQAGHLRTAMDEAFETFKYTPTYLPLHTLIGDLLIQEGRLQDAITKYSVVAEAYSARGEASQAVNLLQRIVQVAPMDLAIHNRLIDQLAARGMVDEAINEYFGLADIYYRLAELDKARKTYATALHLAQQGGTLQAWSVKLMRKMADIDMQRLDWRQALRIFEQIRTLDPDDLTVRKSLIGLNIRLNQPSQAAAELDGFLDYMQISGRGEEIISFLSELAEDFPKEVLLRRALAEQYRKSKRIPEAIKQLDSLGDLLLQSGDREGAIQTIEMILALNPNNTEEYKTLLTRLKSEIQG